MKDYMLRAMTKDGQVRIYAALTTDTAACAKDVHQMYPTSAVALGRTLTAAALMSGTLKSEKSTITIQIKGDGPLGSIVVVTDANSNVRGYVHNPYVDILLNDKGKFDIAGAVGKGYLNVVTDLGLKEPYVGRVKLVSGEIAEDITYYYAASEQTPTVTSLGVLVGRDGNIINAGGLFIQLMPGCSEENISWLEKCVESMPPVTKLLESENSLEQIIEEVLPGRELIFLDTKPVKYQCNCSRERMERNLLSLGIDDLEELAADKKETELICHFCRTKYVFQPSEIDNILSQTRKENISEADENPKE
ncbi:MAG: Hsp33 family molecular chaperone HslO [Clostridiaceae bacterium]|nr:Hsp33 family molecular chaperone HslO [Clostridiaceae bacterium]